MKFTPPMSISTAMLLLAAQFGMNGAAAWLQWRCVRSHPATGPVEKLTAWGVIAAGNIAGLGLLLSAGGVLGPGGFLAGHAALLVLMLGLRRRALRADRDELLALARDCRAQVRRDLWLAAIVAAVGLLGLFAALAQPVVYDSLAYRMPRIGAWLQAGRIVFLQADDPRLDFMPYMPDLTVAWLIGWFPSGYLPAALGQWFGGGLLLLATAGLAGEAGLSRRAARTAVLLLLTMPNVMDQFTAAHTDLYTAGVCGAAFYLGLCALRRGSAPWLGAATLGLAVGCKGTMFYFAPVMVGWIVLLALRHRVPLRAWLGALFAGTVALAVFALPTYWLNARHYESPLGPADFVQVHHQAAKDPAEWLRKGGWNLRSTLAQWCEPNSQPPGLQAASRALGEWLAAGLPARDRFTYRGLSRTETLEGIFARATPDADLTSPGLIALALFLAGWIATWRRPGFEMIRVWGAGVAAFFVFFHFMQQWHPYGFRYFVLAAPWMAVVGVAGLDGSPRKQRLAEAGLALIAAAIFWSANFRTHQSGWRAAAHAEDFAGFQAFAGWRGWLDTFAAGEPVTVALSHNRPLAAFYRREGNPAVRLERLPPAGGQTAEQWVAERPGWSLLPPAGFFGREGRVQSRAWLFAGDPDSPYSIVAFRRLQPGETPAALVYRQQWMAREDSGHFELLVRSWEPKLRLQLENPGPVAVQFHVLTPRAEGKGVVAPGRTTVMEVATLDDKVAEVIVDCDRPGLRARVLP